MDEFNAPVVTDLSLLCPKCGQGNQCAVANGGDASECWCMHVAMDTSCFKNIETNKQCFCLACATQRK
ncbi:MAG: cysteine-rich CWC family protein [Hydromonas sp.]|nr:cysteine-rich CWC family protein [Hydromonas sp.]MBP6295464.1 cysteine-rich CWC family protein [Hydromonas sp.]